jgi:hypothetical protein
MRFQRSGITGKSRIIYGLHSTTYPGQRTLRATSAMEVGTASRVWSMIDLLIS